MNTPTGTFVFGQFIIGEPRVVVSYPPGYPPIAIEVLREFSPTEFIGKVYVRGREGNWTPVHADGATSYDWFTAAKTKKVQFDMASSSARWDVLHFRGENSGTAGQYLAVALKQRTEKGSPSYGKLRIME